MTRLQDLEKRVEELAAANRNAYMKVEQIKSVIIRKFPLLEFDRADNTPCAPTKSNAPVLHFLPSSRLNQKETTDAAPSHS